MNPEVSVPVGTPKCLSLSALSTNRCSLHTLAENAELIAGARTRLRLSWQ